MNSRWSVARKLGVVFWTLFVCGAQIGFATGCGGDDDCLVHGENCSAAFLESEGRSDAECCDGRTCCTLRNGSGVVTCRNSSECG